MQKLYEDFRAVLDQDKHLGLHQARSLRPVWRGVYHSLLLAYLAVPVVLWRALAQQMKDPD